MAPYIGLIDKNGNEIKGKGYRRKDVSQMYFKISPAPPQDLTIDPASVVILNVSEVAWRAQESWPDVYGIALYQEVDDETPFLKEAFRNSKEVDIGDSLILHKGGLKYWCHLRGEFRTEEER